MTTEVQAARTLRARFVLCVLGANFSRAFLYSVAGLLLWAAVPLVIGCHSTVVMSGSMEPAIGVGDIVVLAPPTTTSAIPGRVIQFEDPDKPDHLRLHRIQSEENNVLTTKGDANPQNDSSTIGPADVLGVGIIRVPFVGWPLKSAVDGYWIPAVITLSALIAAACATSLDQEWRETRSTRIAASDTSLRNAASNTPVILRSGADD